MPAEVTTPQVSITIPPVYLPEPLYCHPQVALLQDRGLSWMERHGFLADQAMRTRVADSRAAHFFAYPCPRADADLLQLAVDWAYLMFVFDDVHEGNFGGDNFAFLDLAVRIIRTLEVPSAGVLDSEHPFTGAVTDLARRLHRSACPEQIKRLADAHTTWLMGMGWEIPATQRDVHQPVNDYVVTRMMHGAVAPTLCWLQLAEGELIPESEITSPRVRALTEMAGTVAALDDDLYSYGKDVWFERNVWGRTPRYSSMIRVFMSEQSMTEDEALAECVVLRDRIVARFYELRAQVFQGASRSLTRYLDDLGFLLRGNFEYGLEADRYTNPDGSHPNAVVTNGSVSDAPSASGRPGIAAIDWWWD
ncbi:terpene synthase family protein [Streptomyces sp. NBC_01092]|uniref:terpene synthase family protein n=1 Tax=Streptomyces sp. NBC_01092 TaxID=2903748 RepID=UPI0038656180|nr:terpene synthase family protein [Streptomyces sp. NBC_01092]